MENSGYGLTSENAKESREKHGSNALTELKTEGFFVKLVNNMSDPMIKILCAALFVNVIFVFLGQTEWYETAGIAAAIALAALVSTFQEYKNENAFQKLQAEASKILCKTYRDGHIVLISIDDLVVGDCVLLQPGDKVPADGILLDGSLRLDQSVLNGEAEETQKSPAPAGFADTDGVTDFLNEYKVFRGSVVCAGNAAMLVTTVGDNSVYGKIAGELQQTGGRDTPLKVKLTALAKKISYFGYTGGVAIALVSLFERVVAHNNFDMAAIVAYCSNWAALLSDISQAVMLAAVIIVMAVPEGLPLMIAIVSALNMRKMLRDNVLVRKIAGLETAGSLNILFSDKTGTITKGELKAVIFISGACAKYEEINDIPHRLRRLIGIGITGNTSAIKSGDNIIGGNATERALLKFAAPQTNPADINVINQIPFDSNNKYSASQIDGKYKLTLIKGAPEMILDKCAFYYDEDGNKKPIADARKINAQVDYLARRAIRVLAFAACENEITNGAVPGCEWTLAGIVGIRDSIRLDAVSAIGEVTNAGVQIVMITGDRMETAVAIGVEAGLIKNAADIVLTSNELAGMTDNEVKEKLKDIRVIARALPADKSRMVRIAQEANLVVGMTGDGVNDSPALKAADVGFAMGSGTEVAKEASEIIIMDDNFTSIDKAILYGRTIYNSIRKFIIFQLTINVAAVFVSFAAPLFGTENPLSITQILWVNLVMDTLAALAFGGEPALKRFMRDKPKARDEDILNRYMTSAILTGGLLTFGLSLVFLLSGFSRAQFRPDAENRYLLTGYFTFFVFISVANAFNARADKINLFDNIGKNKGFIKIIAAIAAIQTLMTYLGGAVLRCYGLTAYEWVYVLTLAVLIIPVDMMRKAVVSSVS